MKELENSIAVQMADAGFTEPFIFKCLLLPGALCCFFSMCGLYHRLLSHSLPQFPPVDNRGDDHTLWNRRSVVRIK